MGTTTRNDTANRALQALTEKPHRATPARGKHCPARVEVQDGSTTYTFKLLADDKWRLTYVDTYGNGSFVNGPGCDASGWVVTPGWTAMLDEAVTDAVVTAWGREERDACEAGTPGCSVNHTASATGTSCETW